MNRNIKEIFRLVRENKLATFGASVCSLILAGSLFSAFAVEPQTQSITLSSEFGDIPASETVLTDVQITGVLTPTNIFPSVELTDEQKAKGITYLKKGIWQDTAVVIGEEAKGTVDPNYVETAGSNTILRSVSVAIGGHADAMVTNSSQSQAIAIGWMSQAKASNAIAIGSGNQATNETAMTGDAAYAAGDSSIAMGYGAKATGKQAVQFGKGVNDTAQSFKFFDTYIVKDGKLAIDGSLDTNLITKAISEALDPKFVQDYDDPMEELVYVKSHAITTISFTNRNSLLGVDLEPTSSRNYEVFFPDTPEMRTGLPVGFDTSSTTNLTRLGVWWNRKILKLPFMAKVQEPIKGMVLITAEEYPTLDSAADWTPVITGVVWQTTNDLKTISRVNGSNLHTVKELTLKYYVDESVTNTVAINTFNGELLYEWACPKMDAIAAAANIVSLEVTDYYTTFYKEKAK